MDSEVQEMPAPACATRSRNIANDRGRKVILSTSGHGERPWTLRGLHTPKFGHHLDTARPSEPHI
jgi:hypothetical protein